MQWPSTSPLLWMRGGERLQQWPSKRECLVKQQSQANLHFATTWMSSLSQRCVPSKSSKAKLSFYEIGAHANHLHFCSTIKTMARVHERDHELADCKALGSACIS